MTSEFNIRDWPTLKTQLIITLRKNRRSSWILVFSCNSLVTLSRIWWWGRWCRYPLCASLRLRLVRTWGCQGGWRCGALSPAHVPRVGPVNRKYVCNQKNPGQRKILGYNVLWMIHLPTPRSAAVALHPPFLFWHYPKASFSFNSCVCSFNSYSTCI